MKFPRASRCWLIAAALVLAACNNDKVVDPPAELVDIKPTLKVQKLWSEGMGGDGERLRLALQPMVIEGVVYAASNSGRVIALTADKGKTVWRAKTKLALAAGPGVGEGLVVVGATSGEVVAFDSKTGKERWRQQMSGEVLARPLVAGGLVLVRTVDGRLTALDANDAHTRWTVEESVPRLSLRGTAPPILSGSTVVTGFDNGKLVAVDLNTGDGVWGATIDTPAGRTELDRLADVDAPAAVLGNDVFVVGFQGRLAMLDRESGQIWWAKDASSYRGFGLDEQELYLTQANGVISAMRRSDGNPAWETAALRQRGLTAPAVNGDVLVVGDFEGYVHWLNKADGAIRARVGTDGERITNAPVVVDGRVFVQTDGGKLLAFTAKPIG